MNLVTVEAEQAFERLVARLAEYRTLANAVARRTGGRHAANQRPIHNANALVDLAAIAEAFCVRRLIVASNVGPEELATWKARQKAWKQKANLDLATFQSWKPLMGFVEARNAIQHGQGRLTERQLDTHKQTALGWLDAAAIQRNGDVLLISTDDIDHCAQVCRDFIGWLDTAAPAP